MECRGTKDSCGHTIADFQKLQKEIGTWADIRLLARDMIAILTSDNEVLPSCYEIDRRAMIKAASLVVSAERS